ncbi:MAG: hypothetical protein HY286_15800 [Planctomycetes bacterium]|nr:hypothetical protein [Planctomycetota bacterium]
MERARIIFIIAAFAAFAILIVLRLGYLQIASTDEWRAEAERLTERQRSIPYFRGAILDRKGTEIAVDEATYALDFEYRSFHLKNPIAQALQVESIAGASPSGGVELPTLVKIARDAAGSQFAISNITPGQIAEAEPAAERDALRGGLEKLLNLDALENRAARARFRDAIRARSRTRLAELLPGPCSGISGKISKSAELLDKLDERLKRPAGETLAAVERVRNEIIADVEAGLSKNYESGNIDNIDNVSAERAHRRRKRESWLERLADDVGYPAAELVIFREDEFPGFSVAETTARRYPRSLLPWVVGTLRKPSAEEIQHFREADARLDELARQLDRTEEQEREYAQLQQYVVRHAYEPGEVVGAEGVERAYDAELRGERGRIYEKTSKRGAGFERPETLPPINGKNVTLTIDVELQKTAQDLLAGGVPALPGVQVRGSFAVIDVRTGDVLALAAVPDFTRDDLKDKEKYARLRDIDNDKSNPAHPLHHRGYRPWLPPTPGSSFKIVTALAALEHELITPETMHRCDGRIGMLHCDNVHNEVNLHEAIEESCNCYFGWLGERLGLEALEDAATRFGFSQKTGFDSLEVKGGFGIKTADVDMLRRCGVGYQIDCTPLQVARSYAAIANGGKLMKLRVVNAVGGAPAPVEQIGDINIKPEWLKLIRDSLRDVVAGAHGTARLSGLADLGVAGKTGTAEVDPRNDLNHAWFCGYAPYTNPKVAFAVYIERVKLHGKDVTPLVRALLESKAMAPYLREN